MTILKMQAYGDFDVPYEIDVAVGNEHRVHEMCKRLNDFCKLLPGCEQDVKLSKYLEDREYADKLAHTLVGSGMFSTRQAIEFVTRLRNLCQNSSVYVYEDTFTVNDTIQI